jgi:hypothetical protein
VAAIGLFTPFYHYCDAWLLTDVLGYAKHESIDPRVVPIDLGAPANGLRPPVAALLEAICKPDRAAGAPIATCTRRSLSLPQSVVMDIVFATGSGDPRLVPRLRDDIVSLREAGVSVYAAVAPGIPTVAPIYTALTGVGHTEINVVPLVATGFAWYRHVENVDGKNVFAMPIAVESSEDRAGTSDDGTTLIPVGPHETFQQDYWTVKDATAAFDDDRLGSSTTQGRLYGKTLVVGNGATDVKLPGGRNGFEILNWAISDWFADPRLVQRLTSEPNNLLMIVLTFAASALAALAYVYAFRYVRTRPFGYAIAFGAACLAGFIGIAVFETISILGNYAFSQVSLALLGTVTASGVAARATSDGVKHERFLRDLWAGSQHDPDDRFDVFISYTHDPENAAWVVEHIYEPLSRTIGPSGQPLRIFFDRDSIKTGMDWYERIVRSIHGTAVFLPVYSRGYFRRWFCRDELELALLRRRNDPTFILPVTRVGYKLPRRYASIQALDTNSPMFAEDLVRTLTVSLNKERA